MLDHLALFIPCRRLIRSHATRGHRRSFAVRWPRGQLVQLLEYMRGARSHRLPPISAIPPMDLDGYPVNCYLFRTHFPYRFHSSQTRHIRDVTHRSNPLIERYLRLHELHEGLMNRSSQGHGAEPISLEMAAARQREADRLGRRTNIFVMFMVVALPLARGDTCKLTIPEINEIWDNQIGTFRPVRPVGPNRPERPNFNTML